MQSAATSAKAKPKEGKRKSASAAAPRRDPNENELTCFPSLPQAGAEAADKPKARKEPTNASTSSQSSAAQASLQRIHSAASSPTSPRASHVPSPIPTPSPIQEALTAADPPNRGRLMRSTITRVGSGMNEVKDGFADDEVLKLWNLMKEPDYQKIFDGYKIFYGWEGTPGAQYKAKVAKNRKSPADETIAEEYGTSVHDAILNCEDDIKNYIKANQGVWETITEWFPTNKASRRY